MEPRLKPSVGIVQGRPTQFDGPLFRALTQAGNLELRVYYSGDQDEPIAIDPELGIAPGWNRDITAGYAHVFRTKGVRGSLLLLREIAEGNHDLVVVSGYTSWISLLVACWLNTCGRPVGMRSDSVLMGRRLNGMKERIKKALLPKAFSWMFRTGHPTGTLAREYLLYYGFADSSLFLFPYNVDRDYLHRQSLCFKEIGKLRKRHGIAPDAFVVLGILKLIPREDPITLVKGFIRIAERHPNARLVLVGDGELRGAIEELVRERRVASIKLAGYVPYSDLGYYFGMANVFVHPAVGEPWGVSVNEALACGCPTIAADTVGAAADLVVPGETGFCFRAADPEDLARRLETMIEDKPLLDKMKKGALAKSLQWTYRQTEDHLLSAVDYVRGKSVPVQHGR